jgi:hypothetical protein
MELWNSGPLGQWNMKASNYAGIGKTCPRVCRGRIPRRGESVPCALREELCGTGQRVSEAVHIMEPTWGFEASHVWRTSYASLGSTTFRGTNSAQHSASQRRTSPPRPTSGPDERPQGCGSCHGASASTSAGWRPVWQAWSGTKSGLFKASRVSQGAVSGFGD